MNTIKSIKLKLSHTWQEAAMDAYVIDFNEEGDYERREPLWLAWILHRLIFLHWTIGTWKIEEWVRRLICLIAGHKLHDYGFATPDTGCIHIACERCGRDFGKTILY